MKIYSDVSELVGGTPLVRLGRIESKYGLNVTLLAKLESFNPGGSAKDRVARHIIEEAERRGELTPESAIIEPTSGNTGIGIALIAALRGYRAIIVMPDNMSRERQALMRALGAEVVLTPAALGMKGAISEAERLAAEMPHAYLLGQFTNMGNPEAHKLSTGPEIYNDTDGEVDIFVSAIGTGGTVSGVSEYLKAKKPEVLVAGVEPASSPLLTEGWSATHKIQGIGANFIPRTLNTALVDRIITVEDGEAYELARELARTEGILAGISSGAALAGAVRLCREAENEGKTVVVLLPDTGERYLSCDLF